MDSKLCRRCNTIKLKNEFNNNKNAHDGLQKYCRDCTKKFSRQNKERKAARDGREMKPYKEMKFAQVSEKELLAYLRKFTNEKGRPPTTEDLENNPNYPCAYTYYRRFNYKVEDSEKAENWNAILTLAGIEIMDYFSLWRVWQYFVECAVQLFESDYLFQYTGISKAFRPDIVIPSKKLIIDAATSNYETKVKINQYEEAVKHGYQIEFWCLYKTTVNGINRPDLTYIFADEIITRLEHYNATELINKIQTILQKHELYEQEMITHKKEYIKSKILELTYHLKRVPLLEDFIHNKEFPSATSITTTFGSFNKALQYAGLPTRPKEGNLRKMNVSLSQEQLEAIYKESSSQIEPLPRKPSPFFKLLEEPEPYNARLQERKIIFM
ncbi:MAG: hypothetical protein ABS949_17985 [Solibacillus sp.]